ncbi:PilZ domain-containing protein [uncultured Pseudodesulfovibrio sp.]|uniref:PilZ domain-containing protein n=1 Tax=uncultured Pseudodesulfovibrio sp. TaxID=2035858 RepID=UPI0029C972E3|nr:PilZ domain-containing protein [uncultured Pseudodesulfovibrio sp.]
MNLLNFLKKLFPAFKTSTPKKNGKENTAKQNARPKTVARKKKPAEQTPDLSLKVDGKPKGRLKSKQITADPIDEAALGFSISLKTEDAYAKKRNAIRMTVEGLTVFIPRLKKRFEVSDISATGLGFKFEKPRIKAGVKIKMDIVLKGEKLATDILCQVRRHEKGNVGCAFVELDRAQDDAVHKIVLIGQKEQAARKAARKDKDFSLPT